MTSLEWKLSVRLLKGRGLRQVGSREERARREKFFLTNRGAGGMIGAFDAEESMEKAYAVQVRLSKRRGNFSSVTHLPTFYLLARVQGIRDNVHAHEIVEQMFSFTRKEAVIWIEEVMVGE